MCERQEPRETSFHVKFVIWLVGDAVWVAHSVFIGCFIAEQ